MNWIGAATKMRRMTAGNQEVHREHPMSPPELPHELESYDAPETVAKDCKGNIQTDGGLSCHLSCHLDGACQRRIRRSVSSPRGMYRADLYGPRNDMRPHSVDRGRTSCVGEAEQAQL